MSGRSRDLVRANAPMIPGAKIQPQAKELEEVVLGAMMVEKSAVNAVIDVLQPESFYVEAHGEVFRAIQTLFNKSEPIDLLTVTEQLRKEGSLEMMGGSHRVAELTTRVASSANVEFHARIIAQKHIQRELIRVSNVIIEKAYDETSDVFDLLDEAEERALAVVSEKNPDLPDAERREIARVVGLGALKYADLSNNRQSDYIFDWDKMLALQGNTAPYLQYAYTRVRSIFRKVDAPDFTKVELQLKAPEELALAKHLMNFGQTLEMVAQDYRPNFLCNYLFDLAGHFSRFYEACPVLKAEAAERGSRLALCELSARVLSSGLDALGIEVTEVM